MCVLDILELEGNVGTKLVRHFALDILVKGVLPTVENLALRHECVRITLICYTTARNRFQANQKIDWLDK